MTTTNQALFKPSLSNLNIIDCAKKIGSFSSNIGKSIYHSVRNATAKDVGDFAVRSGTNIAAGALTKAFVGAALASASAPAVATVAITAISVGAVSTKLTHWRDCKKAIANNEEPPKFTWEDYGLKGMFNSAMAGFGAAFSEHVLGLFSPSPAAAEAVLDVENVTITKEMATPPSLPVTAQIISPEILQPVELIQEQMPKIMSVSIPSEFLEPIAPTSITAPVMPLSEVTELGAAPVIVDVIEEVARPPELISPIIEVTDTLKKLSVPEIINYSEPAIERSAPDVTIRSMTPAPLAPIAPEMGFAPQPLPEVVAPIITVDPIEELQAMDLGARANIALESHINGNAQGTADIGYFYFHGQQGLPQDFEKAVDFYREAAAADNRFALRDLTYIEAEAEKALGHAVPALADETALEEAASFISIETVEDVVATPTPLSTTEILQAMDLGAKANIALESHINGNAQGTADIGYFYFHGQQGLPQDYEKAVEFYREAAADGNRFAIRDLAYIETEAEKALGYAVPEMDVDPDTLDSETDVKNITDIAASELQNYELGSRATNALEAHLDGNAQGTADIGYFYFHGQQGLPQDFEKAVEFYREAALNGNGYAIRDLSYVELEAVKSGVKLTEFELPEHLYEKSAPIAQQVPSNSNPVRSGLRASCFGDLQAVNDSVPELKFDCNVKGNHAYIYPGEHVQVTLPGGISQTFNLDVGAGRQSVSNFLQNSVLPTATSNFSLN